MAAGGRGDTSGMTQPKPVIDQEGEPQHNFLENREPSELLMCIILAAAYLGLAKALWPGLEQLRSNISLLWNVEGFFITIASLSLLIGLRPYFSPSGLQMSPRGLKYRGPHWPKRKTLNWEQVTRVYLSPDLILVLYKPTLDSKKIWWLLIWLPYLADRERIGTIFQKYCPIEPVHLTKVPPLTRITAYIMIVLVVLWILHLLAVQPTEVQLPFK